MIKELNLSIVLTESSTNQIKGFWKSTSKENDKKVAYDILKEKLNDYIYDCYLQNATIKRYTKERIRILIASDTMNNSNIEFINKNDDKIISIEGVNEDRSFVVTNIRMIPKNIGIMSSKSILVKIKFCLNYSIRSTTIPNDILEKLYQMPSVSELYKKIDKNIKDWDNYLYIIEENAKKSQLEIQYNGYKQDDLLTHCIFYFENFTKEEVDKLKNFRSERVVLFNNHNDATYEDNIGKISKIDYKNNSIIIDLEPEFQELASQGELNFPHNGNLRISKMGDLAQARNLRRGLFLLKTGQSKNPNLDVILFESENVSREKLNTIKLEDNDLLIKTLNKKQKEAVEGVLNSDDLFLIQGPPGTGKTTVIAEICYQYAIRGKKTLIASQSNLAVDNALSRLKDNPKIKVLRNGNLSRVEKEGEQYTESNIVDTWLKKTSHLCNIKYKEKLKTIDEINFLNNNYMNIKELSLKYNEIDNSIKDKNKNIKSLNNLLNKINDTKRILQEHFKFMEYELDNFCMSLDDDVFYNILMNKSESIYKLLEDDVFNYILNSNDDKYINLDLKRIFDKIKELILEINLNKEKIINISKKLEQIKLIEKLLKNKSIEEIKNNLFYDVEEGKKLKKYIVFLEDKYSEYDNLMYKIIVLKKLNIKIKKNLKKLNYLKEENNIKDISYKTVSNDEVINFNNIKDFENKLKDLLTSKRIWSNEIINFIKKSEIYIEYLNIEIKKLEKNSIEYNNDISFYTNKINNLLKKIEYKNIENKNIAEFQVNESFNNIIKFKSKLTLTKNKLISKITESYNNCNIRISEIKNNITIEIESKSKIEDEINRYNEQIKLITNSSISIEDDYRYMLNMKKEEINKEIVLIHEWINVIENKKYGNKNELRDLYVDSANVIGITCVQSANKEFTEKYPEFDLVIIDEVSKATPPELILPMLKGKKFVLVGDHKQLTPMIGNETFEELKRYNNMSIEENLDDTKNNENDEDNDLEYMKESLFEKLYREARDENKVMLNVQYRMHSSIMHTINQFYCDSENEGLICGDSEEKINKRHNINTSYLKEDNNLLWVDIPLHKNFYEELDEKNSFYNEIEIEVIEKIIDDINNSCDSLEKKEIAVITFYGAQAKKLQNKLVGNNKYNNLRIRVGTVDRFQGMEREIVIVSFVRNNGCGNIGFAKDYKRINVALSRAQKLLIIVGCSELFCYDNKNINARESYSKVLNIVRKYDGVRDANEILN